MPLYVYRASDPETACGTCRQDFEVLQRLGELLEKCPDCGTAVTKQVTAPNAAFPEGPAQLRNMGMARLERRSDGMYENVSAQPGAQKIGALDSFAESLKKGPKPILSD